MKICHYNNNQAGVVVGDKVINFGDAMIKAGLARQGYTMLEIIDALGNNPAALQIARDAANSSGGLDLKSVKLLAPIQNPGTLWAAAANYGAHRAEMVERMGSAERAGPQQRRLDGGVFHQDHLVDHRPRRHDYFAEEIEIGRFRMRAVRRHRQADAQRQRGGLAQLCFRLHDLLGHQPARSLGQRHAKHAQHPQRLRHVHALWALGS